MCNHYSPSLHPFPSLSTHLRMMLPSEEQGLTALSRPGKTETEDTCRSGQGWGNGPVGLRVGLRHLRLQRGPSAAAQLPSEGRVPGEEESAEQPARGVPRRRPPPERTASRLDERQSPGDCASLAGAGRAPQEGEPESRRAWLGARDSGSISGSLKLSVPQLPKPRGRSFPK